MSAMDEWEDPLFPQLHKAPGGRVVDQERKECGQPSSANQRIDRDQPLFKGDGSQIMMP